MCFLFANEADFTVRLLLGRLKEMPGALVPDHGMSGGWAGSRM
ncbi:hypothetical protein [Candidatus Nitrotoga fabula]|nr:hypothetical protein [Candidatus Nitrotoga fabula]